MTHKNEIPPVLIIGILVLLLSFIWIGSNLSLVYEWENSKFSDAVVVKGKVLDKQWSNHYINSYFTAQEIEFEFYTNKNEYISSASYGLIGKKKKNDEVQVEYIKDNPDLCRIVNTQHRLATRPSATDISSFVVGIVLCFIGLKQRKKLQKSTF